MQLQATSIIQSHAQQVASDRSKCAVDGYNFFSYKYISIVHSSIYKGTSCVFCPATTGVERNDSAKNGQGLADIEPHFTKHEKRHKSTAATNRALIQYFAKLGQSSTVEESLDLDFIEGLIKQGADVNCTDIFGQTIFHEVSGGGEQDVHIFY